MKKSKLPYLIGILASTCALIIIVYLALVLYLLPETGVIISKDSALRIAESSYPNTSFTSDSEYLWIGLDNTSMVKPVWKVTVTGRYYGSQKVTYPDGSTGETMVPLWDGGGFVTIDAATGKVIHKDSYG